MKKLFTMIIKSFDQIGQSHTDEFDVEADLKLVGRGDTEHIKKQVNEMHRDSMTYPPVSEIEILEVEPDSPLARWRYDD